MHSYFRAIGYSNVVTAPDTEKLIDRILHDKSAERVTEDKESYPMREYRYEIAENMGIMVRCEVDTNPLSESETALRVLNYFPYFKSTVPSIYSDVYVSKKVDTRAYHGMCDDYRLGVSLIFYMLNTVDYLNNKLKFKNGCLLRPVSVSALSLEGKILLPLSDTCKVEIPKLGPAQDMFAEDTRTPYAQDFDSSRAGAFLNRVENYAEVARRARKEDVFSIVETTFIPYGAESDVYNILGIIEKVKLLKNKDTGEDVYVLSVLCNGIYMDVCINAGDLLGEPAVGRRFRGIVWIQGDVDFAYTST